MTYKEFKETYKWLVKNYPDATSIYSDNMEEKNGIVKITKQVKTGSRWKTIEEETEEMTRRFYMNCVDAIPFFRNCGGIETVTKCYTKYGLIPVKVISTSPDREQRTIREFIF